MAIPSSGPISLTDVQTEFGGSNPISLSEYYAGGGLVPAGTSGTYGAVPSSGAISLQNFYGTSNISQWLVIVQWSSDTTKLLTCTGIALDSSKNIYAAGITNQTGYKGWLGKFNASGTLQWQYRYNPSSGSYSINLLTCDSSNNLYAVGVYETSSNANLSIIKFNTSGAIAWQRQIGAGASENGYGIAVAASGNVYTNGYCYSTPRQFFTKYDTYGNLQWQAGLTSASQDAYGYGVGIDSSENVYFGGYMRPFRRMGSISKFYSFGVRQWTKLLGNYGGNNTYIFALTADSSGNSYATGTATNSAGQALFVIKVDTSGVAQWKRQLKYDYSYAYGGGICVDSSGNVYVVGNDGGAGVPSGTSNPAVVAKYNSSGVLQFQRYLYTAVSGSGEPTGIQVDESGSMIIGLTGSPSGFRGLVAKLPTDGSKTGTYSVNGITILYTAASFTETELNEAFDEYSYNDETTTFASSASANDTTSGNLDTYKTSV